MPPSGKAASKESMQKSSQGAVMIQLHWEVVLPDGKHKLSFAHNTMTGNREMKFDGKRVYRSGWMFKLVGPTSVSFDHGGFPTIKANINIKVVNLRYTYVISINGKELSALSENVRQISRTWKVETADGKHIVVLEKDKMDIWVDGDLVEATDEFTDEGTEASFEIGGHNFCIVTATSDGNTKKGTKLEQILFVDDVEVTETFENRLIV